MLTLIFTAVSFNLGGAQAYTNDVHIFDLGYKLFVQSPKGAYFLFIEYSNIPYLLNTAKDDYSLYIFDLVGAQAWSPPTPAQRPWSSRAS